MSVQQTEAKRVYAARMPKEERRQQIVEAALEEYLAKGFSGARVDTIAEAIGVSKPVLYSVFDSKEAIAVAVVEEAHRREALLNLEADNLEGYSRIDEGEVVPLFKTAFCVAEENPRLMTFLYSDFRGAPPEAIDYHDEVFEQRTEGIKWHLDRFFEDHPAGEDISQVAASIISATGRRGILEVARGDVDDHSALADLYGGVVERGIRFT